jgi:hypothetical protein
MSRRTRTEMALKLQTWSFDSYDMINFGSIIFNPLATNSQRSEMVHINHSFYGLVRSQKKHGPAYASVVAVLVVTHTAPPPHQSSGRLWIYRCLC